MKVKVKYLLWLAQRRGLSDEEIEVLPGSTIEDLLRLLRNVNGIRDHIDGILSGRSEIIILHNNLTPTNGLKTRLRNGDLIILMPPVSGG